MDTVQSDSEDELDKLMNGSDTKSVVPGKIKLTDNPDNASTSTSALTS